MFSICIWAGMLLLLTAAALLRDSPLALGLAGLLVLLPCISLLIDLRIRKKTAFFLSVPTTAEKGQAISVSLTAENRSRLLPGECTAHLKLENLLTEETQTLEIAVNPLPRQRCERTFSFSSPHCGTLLISAVAPRITDWLGIFSMKAGAPLKAKCTVLPDTFAMEPQTALLQIPNAESEDFSPLIPGNDPTEIFDLREYTPGDDIRRIHYKLSAKTDQLIVRRFSLPVNRTVLLYWHRAAGHPSPAETDAAAECIVSLGQALRGAEQKFSLGWRCADGCRTEPIETDEAFSAAVVRMLGAFEQTATAAAIEALPDFDRFGRILYFTAQTDVPDISSDRVRVIRCAEDAEITPENYAEVFPRTDL